MKHITIVLALAGLLFLLVLSPYGCSKRLPRQVSLAEASKIVNAPFPVPAYLPEGFSITAIYALYHDDESDGLGVTFYPAGTVAGGVADVDKAPIRMIATLHRKGQFGGLKLVGEDYDVAGIRGVLVPRDDSNDLFWILPHPESPGEYLMEMKGNKDIPKEELVKMARSVPQ
ncbi:MAG: hypothetical protein HYX84_03880 [Chloroflexi bacterium]|nr:hypothetical protein [Chloroflexota bacterium]